jgi:hypothetical protein
MPVVEAVTGVPALITLASSRPFVAIPSFTRAAMPIPATMVAQTSETTTIFVGNGDGLLPGFHQTYSWRD